MGNLKLRALVILVTVAAAVPAVAATRFVAVGGTDGANTCLVQASPCASIQHAIGQAVGGDEIEVAAGSYVEGPQILIDRDLSLRGAGIGATIVTPSADTTNTGDGRGWFLVQPAIVFHLADMTLDGSGFLIRQGIRHRGSGTIERVAFTQMRFSQYAGNAVVAFGGAVDISDSVFTAIERVGVLYFGVGVSTSTFQRNTYTGKGTGDHLDYMLDIGNGATVDALDNFVSNNLGIAVDGSRSGGILITTLSAPGSSALIEGNIFENNNCGVIIGFDDTDPSGATIRCNRFSGNDDGIDARGADGSQVSATMNTIAGNNQGINAIFPSGSVDAMGNWWGSPDGPSGGGSGSGDTANGPIDFSNFSGQPDNCAPIPDIDLTKEADPRIAVVGSTVVYTLSYSNNGPATALAAVLRETVPAGATFNASASTAGWLCADGSPAGTPCDLPVGDVAPGDTRSVEFAIDIADRAGGELINRVTFEDTQGDIVETEVSVPVIEGTTPAPAVSWLGLVAATLSLVIVGRQRFHRLL